MGILPDFDTFVFEVDLVCICVLSVCGLFDLEEKKSFGSWLL